MSFPRWISVMRRASFVASAALLAAGFLSAQSAFPQKQSTPTTPSAGFSSSSESSSLELAGAVLPDGVAALPSAPPPSASAAGSAAAQQERGWRHSVAGKLAFEAGGGINGPAGDKAYITWGGQFTVGGGLNLSNHLAVLAEYQFIDDKLPGAIIAEASAQGGHVHLWSLTLDPVIDLFPKATNDVYVTGGGGFYRKVTSFTDPEEEEECYYFCEIVTANAVVGHFSSNQGGFNVGAGFQHRVGGMYGDGKTKLFAEVRYVDAFTPAVIGATPNGLGATTVAAGTKVIPISFGVRF